MKPRSLSARVLFALAFALAFLGPAHVALRMPVAAADGVRVPGPRIGGPLAVPGPTFGALGSGTAPQGVLLTGAGVDAFSVGNTIQSSAGVTVDMTPGRSLALVYFAFAAPAGMTEQVLGSNTPPITTGKGWRIVNQLPSSGVYLSRAGGGATRILSNAFTLGLHRLVVVWRASDNHLLVSHNGSTFTDQGSLTTGTAPDSTSITNIGSKLTDGTYNSLASGSVCAWAIIGSEVSQANAQLLTTIPTTTSRFSFSGTWLETPLGGNAIVDFDALRDWNGSASSIHTLGSSPITLAVSGSPNRTNYTERRVPTTDAMYFDSKLSVPETGYTVRSAYARLKLSGVSGHHVGYDYFDNFQSSAPQSGIGAYANGTYYAQNQETTGTSGADDFVWGTPASNASVELWEGNQILNSGTPYPPTGVFVTAVRVPIGASLVLPTGPPQKRLVILGDSIMSGFYPALPFQTSVTPKLRADFPTSGTGGVTCHCWGGSAFSVIGGTSGDRSTLAALLASELDGTVAKYLWIELSTNDYALGNWATAAAFGTAYGDLLDKVHAASPSTAIYAQTAFPRVSPSSEAAVGGITLPNYRTQISTACSARSSFCTTVDGTAIYANTTIYDASLAPTGRYYTDGLHNDAAGNGTGDIKAAMKTTIGY